MSLKIMVVDQDPETLKYMRSLVAPLGHGILTFADAESAAKQAEGHKFDVIFLEMDLPPAGAGGLSLARRILSSPLNHETAIVMLTSTNDADVLRKAFNDGVTFCLTKPIAAERMTPMLLALETLGWKYKIHAGRLPLITPVRCNRGGQETTVRSSNISDSGMLLEPGIPAELGDELLLEFKIAAVNASLKVRAKIVRAESLDRMAVTFVGLQPEERNAIQLYIMGHLRQPMPQRRALRPNPSVPLFRPVKDT